MWDREVKFLLSIVLQLPAYFPSSGQRELGDKESRYFDLDLPREVFQFYLILSWPRDNCRGSR